MARIDDGGPAFARPAYYPDDPEEHLEPEQRKDLWTAAQDGMSLRDHFAGQALAGLASTITAADMMAASFDAIAGTAAAMAYHLADKMIARRSKP